MTRTELLDLFDRVADGDGLAYEQLASLVSTQDPATQALFIEAVEEADNDSLWEQLLLTLAEDDELAAAPMPKPSSAAPVRRAAPTDLTQRLGSGTQSERIAAATALAEYRDPETVPALIAQLSGDKRVADAARKALEEIGPPATPALIEALGGRSEQARWHAAKALALLTDPRAIPALLTALDDGNYGVRWLAAEALAGIGDESIKPLMEHLAAREKPSAWLRQGAQHVLNTAVTRNADRRERYRRWSSQIKGAPTGSIATLAREMLRDLARS